MGTPSFFAYIDESGDDGFVFPRSSEWIIMSAVVVPTGQHSSVIRLTREMLTRVGWSEGRSIHFGRIDHERRVFLMSEAAGLPVMAMSVLFHKPSITEPALQSKGTGLLFGYMVRMLLERISWYCRDHRPVGDPGDGTVHLIFDNRTRGSHLKIRAYVIHLREAVETRIHWPVIVNENIDARTPRDQLCLHLPDIIAGGMRAALESSQFGHTEHRFAKLSKPITYCRNSIYNGYGIKFFPRGPDTEKHRWLTKYYGWK